MHCLARPSFGRAGPARCAAFVALGLAFNALRLAAQGEIPLPQVLAEAEQAIAARRPADAAPLLDFALARAERGEPLPGGLPVERLRLAAATVQFQSQGYARAQAIAEALVAARPVPAVLGEARMILGLSLALQEKFAEAVPVFGALEESAPHRDRARLYRALAAHQAGQVDVAIDAYQRLLASAPRDADWADAALVLVSLHLQRKNLPEAARGLALLQGRRELVDNLAKLNTLGLQLGDALLADGDPEAALAAYRQAVPRDELRRAQAARNERLAAQLARAQALARGPVAALDAYRRIEARLGQAKAALAEVESLAGYDAALFLRLGQAFQERGGAWEAALAFAAVLAGPTDAAERPAAHFGLVRAYAEAGRFARAGDALDRFAAAHPGHELVLRACYAAVLAAQARGDLAVQLDFLARAEGRPGPDEVRELLLILHAQALLAAGRHEEARRRTADYLAAFARGRFAEDATYLQAMAGLLLGRPRQAVAEIEAYLEQYAEGRFETDARYRLAAAHYAMEAYEEAARRTAVWLREQPEDHPQRGEVFSLQGDAWAGLNRIDEAIASYRRALDASLPDELLGYVLDELTRHHQARREFDAAVAMWEAFARERPDHPFVIDAAYWIGRIRVREGRLDDAQARVAEIAGRYLSDPARDGVERLLGELAGMLARPPRAGPDGRRPPAPTDQEIAARAEALLLAGAAAASPTARARVLFVQAEAAALRHDPAAQAARLGRIAEEFRPEALPPGVLGRVGDHLLAAGRREAARTCYERIVSAHGRSIFADFGHVGLGELALAESQPAEALDHFNAAIDRAGARFKLREATLGRARALLALGRLDAAQELFEQVAGNRQWRGEATAESVYALGEILTKRGGRENLAQAQAHYQRVYLSYRKFTPWVARAYLRSAETLGRLGQLAEAAATLREMLRDERLGTRPEAVEARLRLIELESGGAGRSGGSG